MVELEQHLFFDESIFSMFSKRQYNQSFKRALNFVMKKWHKQILKDHFERKAYVKYPNAYLKKKRIGMPMVKKGQLKRSVLRRIDVRGTSKRVRGKVFFGTPKQMSREEQVSKAFMFMHEDNMKFKSALARVQRELGSYAKNKDMFQEQIRALSNRDIQKIKGWLKAFMLNEFKSKGRKRKVKRTSKGSIS